MNHTDFFSKADYMQIKQSIQNKQPFEIIGKHKNQILKFEGAFIEDRYRDIWNGDYLIHINEDHNDGGRGYATDKFDDFETYESFVALVDKMLKNRPGYETADECEEQLSFF